jgi:hypothetical protein
MQKHPSQFIGSLIVIFSIICYFELFAFRFIPYPIRALSPVLGIAVLVFFILIRIIYQPEALIKMNFSFLIMLLILGSLPSYFIARYFHRQTLLISTFANRTIWFYLLYFFVHLYKVPVKHIIRIITVFGLLVVFLYFVQYSIYPTRILAINIIEGRGTIRLFVTGMLCAQFTYFYYLNQFFQKNRPIYLVLSLLTISIFILQGTRQLIFALAFLTVVNLLVSKRIRGRAFMTIGVSAAFVLVFMLFREIFLELTRVSTVQSVNLGSDVRLRAARFFLTEFMPNKWAYILGNGSNGAGSAYDQKMLIYQLKYGFFISDIGVLGDYVKYGIVFVVAGLLLLVKSILFKTTPEFQYLKFYILSQCFTLLTGFGLLGGVDIIILLILYIFDVQRAESLSAGKNEHSGLDPIEAIG